MHTPRLKQRNGTPVDAVRIGELRSGFRGEIILPGDANYDAARRIWNASIDKHPGLIARCAGVPDVIRAVKFARLNDLLVAVRGGGHNVAGRALCDDGLVIDLSAMRSASVDSQQRTARVAGGATLADVDRETQRYGLAIPVGVISRTGIGGLTLGGGVGWLVRKYGLTCDNVQAFEVVTAEGELLTATAESNPDLFWALRGGGGNFGIVTSFLFRAHHVSSVVGGLLIYPRDAALAVMRNYRAFMRSAPDDLTAYAGLLTTPDGTPAVGVLACYCGHLAEGERVLKPLRAFGSPIVDAIQPMTYIAMQTLLEDGFPEGTCNYWKSTFVKNLSDAALEVVIEHANRMESPMSSVVVEMYGGAAGRVGQSDTPVAHRQTPFNIGIVAQWTDPAETERHVAWARALAQALQPYSTGATHLNFMGDESADTIRAAFGGNYARLAQLKAKYDPTNFFSLNQNIAPAR
jgi:FAD/FMN-containing dehydrogenase